jgi:hypothetical protein
MEILAKNTKKYNLQTLYLGTVDALKAAQHFYTKISV